MRYLNWFLRIVLFLALLGLAVKNDQPITLRYFLNYEWQSSLVVVLLAFFAAGVVVGVLAMLTNIVSQRREISRLKRDLKLREKLTELESTQPAPVQPS